MGRGTRPNSATLALRGGTAARDLFAAVSQLRRANPTYFEQLREASNKTAAGRGDRLYTAIKDLEQGYGDSSDPRLAETRIANAIRIGGRLLALHDQEELLLPRWRDFVKAYARENGFEQLSHLAEKGLISAQEKRMLSSEVVSAHLEAYASPTASPKWTAVAIMDRSSRASESIQLYLDNLDEESDSYKIGKYAQKRAASLITHCQKRLRGEVSSNYVNTDGAWLATHFEIVAATLSDPRSQRLNSALAQGKALTKHRALVATVAPLRDRTVIAVPDRRWLDQPMNYQETISAPSTDTSALNSTSFGIYLSPAASATLVRDTEMDRYNEILIHELIHTTQPGDKGRVLPDVGKDPEGLFDRHRYFEHLLLEGTTQALTDHLRRKHDKSYLEGRAYYYPMRTALVGVFADQLPLDQRERFLVELSLTPTNQRTAYLAKRFLGSDDEQAQRRLINTFLLETHEAETKAGITVRDIPLFSARAGRLMHELIS